MRFKYCGTGIIIFARVHFFDLPGGISFYCNPRLIYQFINEDFQVKIKVNPLRKLKIGTQIYTD